MIKTNENNYIKSNFDKISVNTNKRNSIDSSIFIVENSKDLLVNNNNTVNNLLGLGEGEEYFNNYYDEKRNKQNVVVEKKAEE